MLHVRRQRRLVGVWCVVADVRVSLSLSFFWVFPFLLFARVIRVSLALFDGQTQTHTHTQEHPYRQQACINFSPAGSPRSDS